MKRHPCRNVIAASLSLAIFFLIVLPTSAQASIFVVNTTDDLDDGTCNNAHCSLREAINAANANSGPDSIHFDLPGSGGSTNTIELDSLLPALTDDSTIIDGTTEPDYAGSPVVFIHKSLSAGGLEVGLAVESNNNEIRGLVLAGFGTWLNPPNSYPYDLAGGAIFLSGSGNLIENNTIGLGSSWNTIGVRLVGPANSVINNVISGNGGGIYVDQPNNLIQGNMIGPAADGSTPVHNEWGVYIGQGSDGTLVGGAGSGEGNTISANQDYGIWVQGDHCYIYGNLIGVNAAGNAALPNGTIGVALYGDESHLGGPGPGEGNVISGNGSRGVWMSAACLNCVIQGNIIGADISGTTYIPNGSSGIESEASHATIGGSSESMGNLIMGNGYAGINLDDLCSGNLVAHNTIAHNNGDGILLTGGVYESTISHNSIFANGQLGIYIDPESNDNLQPPQNNIQYPQLNGGLGTMISGTACSNCQIEFFIADPDPTGYGEGKEFLADGTASSNGTFNIQLGSIGFCTPVTATVTDADGNTSEFSHNVHANCMVFEPIYLYPIWVFIIIVFGVIGWVIRRLRPSRPAGLIPFTALGGGLLFLALILTLPFVKVDFTPTAAECGNGEVDPGETCDGDDLSLCTSDQVCQNCRCVTEVDWPVCGDGDADGDEQCDGDDLKMCRSDQVCQGCRCVTHVDTEPEDESEPEPEPEQCLYEARQNTNCRVSDYAQSELVTILMQGDVVPLLGLNPEYTYGLFEMEDGELCWIGLSLMGGPENPLGNCPVKLVDPPEETACRPDLDERACIAAGGEWAAGVNPPCICPAE
ncbi:MAG: right-handed parallel beta-helix repeat-containing protein [Anaerolineales bacterium]|jgi:CSLREA domain-containing protein